MRTLFLAVTLLVAIPAYADLPVLCPPCCTVPSHLLVVCSNGSYADFAGTFSIIVRDFADQPMVGCPVDVSFAECPYVRLCTNQLSAGLSLKCAGRVLTRMSGGGGAATFRVIGDAFPAACPSDPSGQVSVYACGVLIGTATVAVLDIDGTPGLSGNDLSEWLAGFFCNSTSPRLDYDGDGTVGGGDLSVWLAAFAGGGSTMG